jgi:hypothetical protein
MSTLSAYYKPKINKPTPQMQPLINPHNKNLKPLPKLFSASGSVAYKRIEKNKT